MHSIGAHDAIEPTRRRSFDAHLDSVGRLGQRLDRVADQVLGVIARGVVEDAAQVAAQDLKVSAHERRRDRRNGSAGLVHEALLAHVRLAGAHRLVQPHSREHSKVHDALEVDGLSAPSLLAHLITEKYCDGLSLFRLEQRFARDGVAVDRGTMARWVADVGTTVVAAMRDEALATAFCIATDATGVAVQPAPDKGVRQVCRRGHHFVQVADKDAVFFEYTPRETSAAVLELFKGFSGYVQADAKRVYDALFRPAEEQPPDGEAELRHEVACWVHCRRGFWEATAAKSAVAREGLARIGRIFELEATWRDMPPEEIHRLRRAHLRPHVEAFFTWAEVEHEKVREERGLLRKSLGYAVRHHEALRRFLEDGRLLLENNRSERELRRIAVGRKAWLFVGGDDHAESAGHLFTLIATARLHCLDPEAYLRDLLRVLAHWPASATWNWLPSTGPLRAPAWWPPSSTPRWAHSPSRSRSPLRPNNSRRRAESAPFTPAA
ncbi:IS66 family transposase [Pyxidicoccus caerfyrddinensis]|uniref:IS66 family transposase n=1 Tax=Pyxidicoccus caerfyrddinensis TaxID=2709663 RepID=UPI001F085060|nr:IS66 family transposase [Pyxidicoccus caerfyrddinensis]